MAQMIPPMPENFNGSPGEQRVFRVLRALPDDVTVLYSLRWVNSGYSKSNGRKLKPQGEGDFVLIDPNRGILVIEVKGGEVRCELGQWFQKNRSTSFEHQIWPEDQASNTKFRILNELSAKLGISNVLVCHAVWFPDAEVPNRELLPMNYHSDMTLDASHLAQQANAIDCVFQYWKNQIPYSRPPAELTNSIKTVLCPTFSIVRSVRQTMDELEETMIQLTHQQSRVIEFLDEQYEAAIVGPAGTGKTLLAVEKARRLAAPAEPVLFLCYNSTLNEHLTENHKHANVSYRSFHGLAREIAGQHISLDDAIRKLLEYLCDGIDLPYSHLVIDEAQDFKVDWLELLRSRFQSGSFYVFYDPFQAVQSDRDTKWLDTIPCRLSVTKNCRNTDQIAKLAYQSAGILNKSKLGVDGPKPTLHPVNNAAES